MGQAVPLEPRTANLSKPHFERSYPNTPAMLHVVAMLTSMGRVPHQFNARGKPIAFAYFGDTPEAVGLRLAREAAIGAGGDGHVVDLL